MGGGGQEENKGMMKALTTRRPPPHAPSPLHLPLLHPIYAFHSFPPLLHLDFTPSGWRTIILWYGHPTTPTPHSPAALSFIFHSAAYVPLICFQSSSSPVPPLPLLLTPSSDTTVPPPSHHPLTTPWPSPSLPTFCCSRCPSDLLQTYHVWASVSRFL